MSVIEVKSVTKDYGGGKGVFDISFSLEKGEVFGFLGPNGAGKTTTIRQLMGFIRPQRGRCSILGLDCTSKAAVIQRDLGYIPGEIAFMDDMTGWSFIKFMAAYRGMKNLDRAEELMARFELDSRGKLKKMSKGMRQKIGIVCGFMHDPAVLILDEPTSGLDPLMQNRFVELIREERRRGKTILMSSHMFEEVERTCDRVGIIRQGHLVAVDEVEALKKAKRRRYTVTLADEAEAAAFAAEGLRVAGREGCRVTVEVQTDLQAFIAAMGRHRVSGLEAASQSLEDVFLQFYGEEAGVHA
ncbi:ATP-binding cassette domain-containing protein [Clostridia bacterium]